jgi:hypothetical protein
MAAPRLAALVLLAVFIDGQVPRPAHSAMAQLAALCGGSLPAPAAPANPRHACSRSPQAPPPLSVEVQSPPPGAWYATGDSSSIPVRIRVAGGSPSASGLAVTCVRALHGCMNCTCVAETRVSASEGLL